MKAKSTDVAAVRSALSGLKGTTIIGDVEMRAVDHQLLRPLVVLEAIKAGDGKGDFALKSVHATQVVAPAPSPPRDARSERLGRTS